MTPSILKTARPQPLAPALLIIVGIAILQILEAIGVDVSIYLQAAGTVLAGGGVAWGVERVTPVRDPRLADGTRLSP
ncbi:MAG: hypothetical protein GY929_09040 [Actinomycetia bacterium]|nr:hypothetical protein [Actinomycetes bacterium]